MSNDHAEVIEEFSESFSRNVDYTKYKFVSNYVPSEIETSMKEEENNREAIAIVENS